MKSRTLFGTVVSLCTVMTAVFVLCNGCGDDKGEGKEIDGSVDAALDGAVDEDSAVEPDSKIPVDGGEIDSSVEEDAGEPDGGSMFDLSLYVEGDLTPKTFDDGYSGQTPSSYTMGISRFDVMTSEDDVSPVTVFDYGEDYTEIDMLTTSLVGSADLTTIPPGIYTYGRVLLKMTRFDVETTVHSTMPPGSMAGTLTVLAALSDTEIEGTQRNQDWVQYTFDVMGGISTTGVLPELPTTSAGKIVRENNETWLVFPFDHAITVLPIPGQAHSATITYEVYESFRWEDQDVSGYTDGVFDSRTDGTSEPVVNFGATGYSISVQ